MNSFFLQKRVSRRPVFTSVCTCIETYRNIFSVDGSVLFSTRVLGERPILKSWNTRDGTPYGIDIVSTRNSTLIPDIWDVYGNLVAIGCVEGSMCNVKVFDVINDNVRISIPMSGAPLAIKWSYNGRFIAIYDHVNLIIYDVKHAKTFKYANVSDVTLNTYMPKVLLEWSRDNTFVLGLVDSDLYTWNMLRLTPGSAHLSGIQSKLLALCVMLGGETDIESLYLICSSLLTDTRFQLVK